MLKNYLEKLWVQAWSMTLDDTAAYLGAWLFRAKRHTMRLTVRRVTTIVARVRLIAVLFAVVSPLWAFVDLWAFSDQVSQSVALVRTLCGVAFAAVVVLVHGAHTLRDAYRSLFFLIAIPATFYLFAYLKVLHIDADGVLDGFAVGIGNMPLVLLAGLSLFPLTVVESASLAAFIIAVHLVATGAYAPGTDWPEFFGMFWELLLIGVIGIVASLTQLAYLINVVRKGLHDSLTGCYSRQPGEELLELQFTWCTRADARLALALVEIDQLQELNEQLGYAAGDVALMEVTQKLNDSMRTGDILIRWTGKQYLLVFMGATAEQASAALGRLLAAGLGSRPDRKPLTASIGVVERIRDGAEDWWQLVDLAESRMSAAQRAGGNRTIEPDTLPEAMPAASGGV